MKKLTLDLDSLVVESFDANVDAGAREHGTVRAHALSGKTCQNGGCNLSFSTCPVPTDPCICDPFEPLTEAEDCV